MCQPWKLLIVYAGLVSSAPTDGRLFSKGIASIRGGGGLRMSMGSLGTKQLRIDSKLQKGSREDPESSGEAKREKAEDKQRREALKAQSDSNQGDDAGSEKSEEGSFFKDLNWEFKGTTMHVIAICLGALIVCTCFFCCVFCICKSKTSDKTEEEAPMTKGGQADVEYIALSDSLMRELVSRSIQRVGPAFAKGAALQDIGQRSFEALTGKAQALLMSELNSAAGSVCKTIDAEEAMLVLEWDAAVRANFPSLTVLLSGLLAPTLLHINLYGHMAIIFLLLLPVAVFCAWAAWQDYGVPCPAIPTLFMWLYAQGVVAVILILSRISMVFQIRAGQAKLQKKAEEFQEKRDGKKLLGSLGELQELFISHSVLVQHALLIEESIVTSVWNKLMGFCTFLWIIVTLWGTVLVLGWTFIPGTVAFHHDAAKAAGDAFCGAWATVFVARLVVIIGILFFLTNIVSALSWLCNLALGTSWVQGKAQNYARSFDARFQGLPVMQVLFKAFVLPREADAKRAQLAAELHEVSLMEQEQEKCEQRMQQLKDDMLIQKKKAEGLRSQMISDGDKQNLEKHLSVLEGRARSAMDGGEWKKHGDDAIEAAHKHALTVEDSSTQELERVFNRIKEAAEQIAQHETTQEMLRKAQQTAQSTAEAGKGKLKEFSESEQGRQVRAAVSSAGATAAAAAERTAATAKEKAADVQEQVKKKAKEGKK